jgi:hypothetical protein
MSYPEKGAGYHHKPKWLGEMKRAEGGEVGNQQSPPPQNNALQQPAKYPNKVQGLSDADIDANKARGDALRDRLGHDPALDEAAGPQD